MNNDQTIDIVFLQTTLFGETNDMLDAINTIDSLKTVRIDVQSEQMGDAEWDNVIEHVMRAKKVITL